MSDPRFPIGKFVPPATTTAADRAGWLREIEQAPALLRAAVAGLDDAQLDTPYREGGWTVRQVLHHVPDSHMNSYVRFKLALTEDAPMVKSYDEEAWALLGDTRDTPIEVSLALLDALHTRWVQLLRGLTDETAARVFVPEGTERRVTLGWAMALYAWHGRHHAAHITELRKSKGW